ncbi:hypothetical protein GCM10027299_54130 [Larkinella ripae]
MLSIQSGAYPLSSSTKQLPKAAQTVYALAGKRFLDLLATFLITVLVLVWLVPLIALAIALTSPGPVFLAQVRTGRNGRPFRCLKFRTSSYEKRLGFGQITRFETQVTAVGRFLRATQLDKLPHFFNILAGEMSIVGPRPQTLQYDAQYWTVPGYRDRHALRPGLTGLAQTRPGCQQLPDELQMQNGVRYDRWYLRQTSLRLDVMICWWAITNKRVVSKKG